MSVMNYGPHKLSSKICSHLGMCLCMCIVRTTCLTRVNAEKHSEASQKSVLEQ